MHSQRTCARHGAPLTSTTNRNRDPGERHMRVCDVAGSPRALCFCHTRSTTPYTCLRNYTPLIMRPHTVAMTTDSLTLKPTSAQQQIYDVRASQKHRLRHRGLSSLLLQHTGGCAHVQSEAIQATGSVTTDSLRLQHTCVCVRSQ